MRFLMWLSRFLCMMPRRSQRYEIAQLLHEYKQAEIAKGEVERWR